MLDIRDKKVMRKFSFLITLYVLNISPTYAYLDPGTGSIILQGVIGGIAAAISFFSLYYQKIKKKLYNIYAKVFHKKKSNIKNNKKCRGILNE